MRSTWLHQLDLSLRGLVPFVFGLLLLLVMLAPWRLPDLGQVTPQLVLMAVFYWTIYRPDRLPYTATFVLGVLQDVFTSNPIGLSALVLLGVQAIVLAQRRFFLGKSFTVVWSGFALVATAAGVAAWLGACAFFGALVAPGPVAIQLLLTVFLYPPMTWVFGRIQGFMGHPL